MYAEFNTDSYIIDRYFNNITNGIMVEAGAGHPDHISMSKSFREAGWRTICVEPNPHFVNLHRGRGNEIYPYALSYKNIQNHDFEIITAPQTDEKDGLAFSAISVKYTGSEKLIKKIIKIDIVTLDWLLDSLKISHIDFVSLDVEGWEIEAMRGFDTTRFGPSIILLENLKHESSYNEYMSSIGYKLSHRIQYNYIYEKNN